jgi:DNA-binding transcriptional ArsR family regulator
MSHEQKASTSVLLCPQAKSFGRHHPSSRFGNLDGRTKTCWELNSVLGVEQNLLSHHLKVLRDEGFVEGNARWQGGTLQSSSRSLSGNADRAIDLAVAAFLNLNSYDVAQKTKTMK